MITMNNEKDYRLIAPDIDSLLRLFRDGHMNACSSTPAVIAAIDPLFEALDALAPSEQNNEYKSISPISCLRKHLLLFGWRN